MRTVRFIRRQWPYQAGEIAGFDDRLAERYVEEGAAEFNLAAPAVEPKPIPQEQAKGRQGRRQPGPAR